MRFKRKIDEKLQDIKFSFNHKTKFLYFIFKTALIQLSVMAFFVALAVAVACFLFG